MQEMRERGWLEGPHSRNEFDVLFENKWLPVHRYALWQRSKWRAIDDFRECGVHSTFSYLERIDLEALDETIWMECCFVNYSVCEKRFDFTLLSGERVSGGVDDAWGTLPSESLQLVTKAIGLKSAYKHVPILPEHRRFSVLILKKPDSGAAVGFVSNPTFW
eukprot:s2230_g9.t1